MNKFLRSLVYWCVVWYIVFWYIIWWACTVILKYFPVAQEVYDEVVCREPRSSAYVPDCFKTQEMCNEAVFNKPYMIYFVLEHFWTQEMCNGIMRTMPDAFHDSLHCLKN